MPKRVNLLPNLRLDINDLQAQTSDYTQDSINQLVKSCVKDTVPAVIAGFRVEIPDQTVSPKMISVYNGLALDNSGQLITNEDEENARRDYTLPTNGTYYVEVQYAETESDVDARGVWDPTYDNGSDTSGDVLPKGREFFTNVATRITPDWSIVTPVSTSGFDITANPNSTKIPVAVILVSGGIVDASVSTSSLTSVTRAEVTSASTSIELFNTREMADAFTLRLSPGLGIQEDVVVTANDRAYGKLTISSTPVNTHPAGTRVIVAGTTPAEFVVENALLSGADQRRRLFQADSNAGGYLSLNPSGTGQAKSDVQVSNLKQYVDFLAAQIREVKYGATLDTDLGQLAPPTGSFNTVNKYVDHAPGIVPSRAITVSVGDGVNTFGDFNVSQMGSAQAAFAAALAIINVRGGTLYVKSGTYSLTASHDITENTHIIGEQDTSITHATSGSVFIPKSCNLRLSNLTLGNLGDSSGACNYQLVADNCTIGTIAGSVAATLTACQVNDINATLFSGTCVDCTFTRAISSVADRLVKVTRLGTSSYGAHGAKSAGTLFKNCLFTSGSGSMTYLVELNSGGTTNYCNNLSFENCVFAVTGGTASIYAQKPKYFSLRSCVVAGNGIEFSDAVEGVIDDCSFNFSYTNANAVKLTSPQNVTIRSSKFTQTGENISYTPYAVYCSTNANVTIVDNEFVNCDYPVYAYNGLYNSIIRDNKVTYNGRTGIYVSGSSSYPVSNSKILDNVFTELDSTDTTINGIKITGGSLSLEQVTIAGNTFTNVGSVADNTNVYGIDISGCYEAHRVQICNNTFENLSASTNIDVIKTTSMYRCKVDKNVIHDIATTAASTSTTRGISSPYIYDTSVDDNNISNISSAGTTSTYFSAIYVTKAAWCNSINNNLVNSVAGASTLVGCGGIAVNTASGTSGYASLSIANNTLNDVYTSDTGGGNCAYVAVIDAASVLTIANNNLFSSSATHYTKTGILVKDGGSYSEVNRVNISGNTVNGLSVSSYLSAAIQYSNDRASTENLVTISNNTIYGTCGTGIFVNGTGTNFAKRFTATGNTIYSKVYGIYVERARDGAITGNVIKTTDSYTVSNIKLNYCLFVSVSGNTGQMDALDSASACIDASNSNNADINLTGNTLTWGSATTVDSHGIYLHETEGSPIYATGNFFNTLATGGGGKCVYNGSGEATSFTRALLNADWVTSTTPTGYTDIGLNFRKRASA